MEVLREIIRGIAVIIILAGFLEMLLPDNEMRRYIQLVVGLFVIISLFTPLTRLLSYGKENLEVAAWQPLTKNFASSPVQKGKDMARNEQEKLRMGNEERMLAQISALAKLHIEVEKVDVKMIPFEPKSTGEKLEILLSFAKGVTSKEKELISSRVQDTITAFFNYPKENILVTYNEEE